MLWMNFPEGSADLAVYKQAVVACKMGGHYFFKQIESAESGVMKL